MLDKYYIKKKKEEKEGREGLRKEDKNNKLFENQGC